jgi:hypothetical protein
VPKQFPNGSGPAWHAIVESEIVYAKGKKKKFEAAFGRLSAAMIDIDPKSEK